MKFYCKACLAESFRRTLLTCSWEGKIGCCLREEKNVPRQRLRKSKKISK